VEIFWSSIDLTRIVFLLGAVLALVYKKKFGVTPGGIIVPGTLTGMLFTSFTAFIIVLATATLCFLIYKFSFARYALSRRWASLITISISVCLGLIGMALAEATHILSHELLMFTLVVPGLLAISAQKYGLGRVALGALSVTALCYLAGWALVLTLPYDLLTTMTTQLGKYTQLSLVNPYVLLPVSLATAILVYYKFGIRGGGYLVMPFLASITLSSPLQALLLAVGVAFSYVIVKLALKFTLMIGLERFVFSLFCGYVMVTLIDLLAVQINIPGYRPAPLVLIIAIAVLTNDLTLQSLKDTLKKGVGPMVALAHLARLAV
jgi:hypothetical protein